VQERWVQKCTADETASDPDIRVVIILAQAVHRTQASNFDAHPHSCIRRQWCAASCVLSQFSCGPADRWRISQRGG